MDRSLNFRLTELFPDAIQDMMKDDSPRLIPITRKELILENLDWFELPARIGELVENVLDGKIREQSLVCCHSACNVCNATIRSCVRKVQREWEELGQSV